MSLQCLYSILPRHPKPILFALIPRNDAPLPSLRIVDDIELFPAPTQKIYQLPVPTTERTSELPPSWNINEIALGDLHFLLGRIVPSAGVYVAVNEGGVVCGMDDIEPLVLVRMPVECCADVVGCDATEVNARSRETRVVSDGELVALSRGIDRVPAMAAMVTDEVCSMNDMVLHTGHCGKYE